MKTQTGGWLRQAGFMRRRAVGYILFPVILILLTGRWLAVKSAQLVTSPRLTTVVAGGDQSPLGGVFDSDGTPAMGLGSPGPAGTADTVFFAFVTDGSARQGIFRVVGNSVTPVVAVGDPTPLGGTFSFFFPPSHNQAGDIAFSALVEGGTAPQGVFLLSNDRINKLAAVTDETPLGKISALLSPPALNNAGEVVFTTALEGEAAPSAILRTAGGKLSKVAEDGDITLHGEKVSLVTDPAPLALNDAGEVAFSTEQGIFVVSRAGSIMKRVAVGDPTPLGGAFAAFTPPALNNAGALAFGATIADGLISQGIFVAVGGQIIPIVAESDPTPLGGAFALRLGVSAPSVLNDRGEVLFSAYLSGYPAVGGLFPEPTGLFLFSGGQVSKVVAAGDPSPLGGTFLSGLGAFVLSNSGTAQFMGVVDLDGDGNPNNQGIFAVKAAGF